ncbi:MAG TPA: hypothetical protein VMU67_13580 [Steroidobacteraceae bacterium]|nr:hypothetical protein [Steroidobacteraceae bacterium]
MRTKIARWVRRNRGELLALGPYLALAVVLPGGSVLAALAWLQRYHERRETRA